LGYSWNIGHETWQADKSLNQMKSSKYSHVWLPADI
jgi:hypothetical protein